MKKERDMTVKSMKEDHEKYTAKMNADHTDKVKKINEDFEKKISSKEASHAATLKKLEDDRVKKEQEFENERQNFKKQIKEL